MFTPKLNIQRKKLREYCERLIFSDPILYGHKGEELLWRKGYYDIITTAKKFRKQREYTPEEIGNIESHINAGVGFYHHYITKLQLQYNLDLNGVIDFTVYNIDKSGIEKEHVEIGDVKKWAKESIHRCLIHLGDLYRYKFDIYPNWQTNLAIRYYSQALYMNSDYGMPHNQMGTLALAQNRSLDAVYHYMHCLACNISFEGTENNLQRLFEKNSEYLERLPNTNNSGNDIEVIDDKTNHIKQMLARFFLLIDVWYFDKSVAHIYNLCHKTYIDLEECLSYYKPVASESGDDSVEADTQNTVNTYLTSDSLFKIVVICLLCIEKLQKQHSNHLSTVIAFTLAIYSQLIQNVITHLQQAVLSFPLAEASTTEKLATKVRKSGKKKIQLRRRRRSVQESDSELSENENVIEIDSSSVESELSDSDVQLVTSSDEEIEDNDTDKKSPTTESISIETIDVTNDLIIKKTVDDMTIIGKIKAMEAVDILEIIAEEGFLQSIKIINDWLMYEDDILKSCSKSSTSLLRQITCLLNLLNIDFTTKEMHGIELKTVQSHFSNIGLPEDVLLKGVEIIAGSQKNIEWKKTHKTNMSIKEECIVRVQKIIYFGNYLTTIKETGIKFDDKRKLFICEIDNSEEKLPTVTFEELVSSLYT